MNRRIQPKSGFTLVEMMVVVGIMVVLTAITATLVRLTVDGDKVRAGARQVQSFLAGARDRAIYAKAPRGVRFLVDPTNTQTVSSMVYIAATDDWTLGTIQLEMDPVNIGKPQIVRGFDGVVAAATPTQWNYLLNQGLLRNGARIKIPNDPTGTWYTITTEMVIGGSSVNLVTVNAPALRLTTPYVSPPSNPSAPSAVVGAVGVSAYTTGAPVSYLLQLPPSVLPNQEAVQMPKGAVIDLNRCNKNPNSPSVSTATLPAQWFLAGPPFVYSTQMDVMFSPRGTVIGTAAGRGLIHFYVADQKDADKGLSPEVAKGDKTIVSMFGRTGGVSTHPVDLNDQLTLPGGVTVIDYFRYAETGEVAGK